MYGSSPDYLSLIHTTKLYQFLEILAPNSGEESALKEDAVGPD